MKVDICECVLCIRQRNCHTHTFYPWWARTRSNSVHETCRCLCKTNRANCNTHTEHNLCTQKSGKFHLDFKLPLINAPCKSNASQKTQQALWECITIEKSVAVAFSTWHDLPFRARTFPPRTSRCILLLITEANKKHTHTLASSLSLPRFHMHKFTLKTNRQCLGFTIAISHSIKFYKHFPTIPVCANALSFFFFFILFSFALSTMPYKIVIVVVVTIIFIPYK